MNELITQFLIHLPIGVFVIIFAQFAAEKGNLLYPISWLVEKLPDSIMMYLAKPLYACSICMASVWGTATFVVSSWARFHQMNLFAWIAYCVVLSGIMRLLAYYDLIPSWGEESVVPEEEIDQNWT